MRGIYSFPDDENKPRTARKWAEKGFLVKDGAEGEVMYSNRNFSTATYYFREDVYAASNEELTAYRQKERQKKNDRTRIKRQIERERIEKEISPMLRFLAMHRNSKDALTIAVRKAVKDAIREFKMDNGSSPLFSYFNLHHLLSMTDELTPVLSDAIVIDTETTGLSTLDGAEILQLSIINQDGEILFNEYFKPMFAESWEVAMRINHITPEMVANKPHIYERMQEIHAILRGTKCVIGYNTAFDLRMLEAFGLDIADTVTVVDVMRLFTPVRGIWNEQFGSYERQSLQKCAQYYHYDWGNDTAHDSLADCRATLFCYRKTTGLPF